MLDLSLPHLLRPASEEIDPQWLLVLLHGIGSNERDLFNLAAHVPDCFHVLSLRAPFSMAPDAWGWFGFTLNPDGSRTIDADQEAESRARLGEAVAAATAQLGVDPTSVVVGGFGQGGIMALSLMLTEPHLARAAMVMHSRLLPEVLPLIAPSRQLRGRQLRLSYGTEDPLIPLHFAHEIRAAMKKLPVRCTYTEYPGGHELRPAEVHGAMQWLTDLAAMG